jgi:hypothetical protein
MPTPTLTGSPPAPADPRHATSLPVDVIGSDLPCVNCGYNLRSLSTSGHCAECGRPIFETTRVTGPVEVFAEHPNLAADRAHFVDCWRFIPLGVLLVLAGVLSVLGFGLAAGWSVGLAVALPVGWLAIGPPLIRRRHSQLIIGRKALYYRELVPVSALQSLEGVKRAGPLQGWWELSVDRENVLGVSFWPGWFNHWGACWALHLRHEPTPLWLPGTLANPEGLLACFGQAPDQPERCLRRWRVGMALTGALLLAGPLLGLAAWLGQSQGWGWPGQILAWACLPAGPLGIYLGLKDPLMTPHLKPLWPILGLAMSTLALVL